MTEFVPIAEMMPSDPRETLDGQGVTTNEPLRQKAIVFPAPSNQYIGERNGQKLVRHESENSRNVTPTALLEERMKLSPPPCCSSDNDPADEAANCLSILSSPEPIGPLIQVSEVTFDRDVGP